MKTVFFDIDTQIDFLYPAGALYAPGAEHVAGNVTALNRYAAAKSIPLISTMDAHAENDPEFAHWPPHCVVQTSGQHKPAATLLDKRVVIRNEKTTDFPLDGAQQILLEKQANDCFTNVNLPGILKQLNADRYVVYGVVTEICVKCAAFGLLKTGKRVELVTDAVRSLDDTKANAMLAEFTAQGGVLTTVSAITAN
jgi:nicotinamidase/pyrazinamidase